MIAAVAVQSSSRCAARPKPWFRQGTPAATAAGRISPKPFARRPRLTVWFAGPSPRPSRWRAAMARRVSRRRSFLSERNTTASREHDVGGQHQPPPRRRQRRQRVAAATTRTFGALKSAYRPHSQRPVPQGRLNRAFDSRDRTERRSGEPYRTDAAQVGRPFLSAVSLVVKTPAARPRPGGHSGLPVVPPGRQRPSTTRMPCGPLGPRLPVGQPSSRSQPLVPGSCRRLGTSAPRSVSRSACRRSARSRAARSASPMLERGEDPSA